MITHQEVSDRAILDLSLNGLSGARDPTSNNTGDTHGTACAGVAAARAGNGLCGQGVAPKASLAGRSIFGTVWSGSIATYVTALYNTDVSGDGKVVSVNSNRYIYISFAHPPVIMTLTCIRDIALTVTCL
jgi:subtilisin family serine protease